MSSSDAHYLSRLVDYITTKEKEIAEENNKVLDLKNVNFLERESEKIIT